MSPKRFLAAIVRLAFAASILMPLQTAHAAPHPVTNTNDSGAGSLRWAIEQANANPGPDIIQFEIPGCGGVCTIQPTSALPILTDDETTIDGYTQSGASPATADDPAVILIEIDGTLAGDASGLEISSADNVIRGLVINRFKYGIYLSGGSATGNIIAGNYIGTGADGASDLGNNESGIVIRAGANHNTVGGDGPAERNVISGNAVDGIGINGSGTISNTISGNYIGTDASGLAALANRFAGVYLYADTQSNTIGPDNLISGNLGSGIEINGTGTMSNTVVSNYIGVDVSGTNALGNRSSGVFIYNGSQHNIIGMRTGGDDVNKRNIISGNGEHGVVIHGTDTAWNTVGGNYIGLDGRGAADLGNDEFGINIEDGAHSNIIGGNTISGNEFGIWLEGVGTSYNVIISNKIGTAANEVDAIGNAQNGVHLSAEAQSTYTLGNHIAYNGGDGVGVDTPFAFNNSLSANSIHDNDGEGINLTNGANHGILPPVILTAAPVTDTLVVSGAACPNCEIQVFASPDGDGEGKIFLWFGESGPAGDFDIPINDLTYPYLTATATNPGDGTSEFSEVFTVTLPILGTSTKSVDRVEVYPGEILTYTLTLTNTGLSAAAAVLTDTLPVEVAWVGEFSVSAGALTWDGANNRFLWNGPVDLDAPVTITFQAVVSASLSAGTVITNTAVISDGLSIEIGPAVVTVAELQHIYLPIILKDD